MIVDQAEKLRLMVRETRKSAHIITVASGKGGVGKTNVAANLAICLTASGKNVILMDADLGLANLDVILNIRARHTLAHVISGARRLDQIIQPGPAGLNLICGASGLTELADLTRFQRESLLRELTALEHRADYIIIDTSAGISADVLCFCEAAHQTLVVATPEPTSLTDAYALIKRLNMGRSGTTISLLVNMAESRTEAKKVHQRLALAARKFLSASLYDAGYILRDEHVSEAVSKGQPLVLAWPRCRASYCFLALAGKLNRAAAAAVSEPGFFRKVVNWFF